MEVKAAIALTPLKHTPHSMQHVSSSYPLCAAAQTRSAPRLGRSLLFSGVFGRSRQRLQLIQFGSFQSELGCSQPSLAVFGRTRWITAILGQSAVSSIPLWPSRSPLATAVTPTHFHNHRAHSDFLQHKHRYKGIYCI